MKKGLLLAVACLLFISSAIAQGGDKLSGSIDTKETIRATVSLLRAADSAVIKLAATDKGGRFLFEGLANGRYLVSATAVGYATAYSPVTEIHAQQQDVQLGLLHLAPGGKALTGVVVNAKRPLIEQRIDRTIVNVEASVMNIGATALEVLERSPGVTVDREGNISLKGKEGVLIMVDGRPTQLGGADLANLLRNMNAAQLDQIEIMTNPPARYDAAGTSGIINIKTKKTTTAGYNGSASVSIMQGRYPKTAEGFNGNYRQGKVNLFANLSHSYRKMFSTTTYQRNILNAGTNDPVQYFDQQSDRLSESNAYNAKLGLDFFANKTTTIGLVVNGTSSPSTTGNESTTRIFSAANVLENVNLARVDHTAKWKSFSSNLNFRKVLDGKGSELTSDLDLLSYGGGNKQHMVNTYTDASGDILEKPDTLKGDLPQSIKVYSGRLDYLRPVKKGGRFEAGIKSSLVKTDNNAGYDSVLYGQLVHDVARSNHFIYEENIQAAYVNLSLPLSKKWSAQGGLRLEHTNMKGTQETTGETFSRAYTQLFPTAFVQYKADDKHLFGASFGRRVKRPNYAFLNPFIRFTDRYLYLKGNPDLKPSLSYNVELSHSWRNQITTTLNYTATTDIIDEVVEQQGQETYSGPANIASLRQVGIAVSANTPVTKWWTSTINVNAFHNRYNGVVSGAPVSIAATSVIITGTQQFKLNKTLTAEISGRFRNGWLEGVMRARPIGFLNAGISQQVLGGKGSLRLTVRDIFYSQRFRGESRYGNVDFRVMDVNESRVASLGFTYRFSQGKKIAPVKRTAGSANEEQERISQ